MYNRPYDDQSQIRINLETQAKLAIQQEIREGKVDLVTSYILIAENSMNRFEMKRKDIKAFIDNYTHTFISKESDNKVKELARNIMNTGVKIMDACHVSCAILAECDYFITTDKRLLKYQSEYIKIYNPINYIIEMEGKG